MEHGAVHEDGESVFSRLGRGARRQLDACLFLRDLAVRYLRLLARARRLPTHVEISEFVREDLAKDLWCRPVHGRVGKTIAVEGADGQVRRCLNTASYHYLDLWDAIEARITPADASLEPAPELHTALEARIASFLGTERAAVYGTGFGTSVVGIVGLLEGRDALVFSDAQMHASAILALRQGAAEVRVYPHNDMAALEKMLARSVSEGVAREREVWVLTEGLFSMSGTFPKLGELVRLRRRFAPKECASST